MIMHDSVTIIISVYSWVLQIANWLKIINDIDLITAWENSARCWTAACRIYNTRMRTYRGRGTRVRGNGIMRACRFWAWLVMSVVELMSHELRCSDRRTIWLNIDQYKLPSLETCRPFGLLYCTCPSVSSWWQLVLAAAVMKAASLSAPSSSVSLYLGYMLL